jgi:methionyl-tRNA formyltransferase
MSKRILFFGNERLATGVHTGVSTLQALLASGYEVPAVIVAQSPDGKSRRERQLEVSAIAGQHGIPVLTPDGLLEARGQLAGFQAEAAVLVSYGKILPPAILNLFPYGIINIHPSLLPLHRGPTPIENAILGGDSQTGVSLIRLSDKMDAGPVYARQTVALDGTETKQALANRLSAIGSDMVLEYLPKIIDGSFKPSAQDDQAATYDRLITKDDSRLEWDKPAARLEREVRAYAGWPRSRTTIGFTDVIITGTHASQGAGKPGNLQLGDKQLGIYCGEGVLTIDSLIPAGKKEMAAAAFLAGYKLT